MSWVGPNVRDLMGEVRGYGQNVVGGFKSPGLNMRSSWVRLKSCGWV